MLAPFFHAWERRLADVSKDRVVRPFDWGLDWIPNHTGEHTPNGTFRPEPGDPPHAVPSDILGEWVSSVMADTDAFFTPPPTNDYRIEAREDGSKDLTFPSALATPHPDNNTVR